MFEENIIRKIIKKQINEGKKKFVIFPFGSNGINVRNCLIDCFQMDPEIIIDNEYSKYNSNIKDFEYLKGNYTDEMTILLTVEDDKLNVDMERQLLSFVPQSNIVNLCSIIDQKNMEMWVEGKFALKSFLPNFCSGKYFDNYTSDNRIKIRFLHSSVSFWNNISSICEAFKNDKKYDILIILRDLDSKKTIKQVRDEGYKFVKVSDYNVEDDKPDVLILSHMLERSIITNCRSYVKLVVVATQPLIRYAYSLDKLWKTMQIGYRRFRPDYYLFDSLLYSEIKNSRYYSDKIVEMGNAKFDGIYKKCTGKKQYPLAWGKLKGKKIILWTTDHGINEGNLIGDYITFDLYAKIIFQYALNHPNIGFIMRLHNAFVNEMIENGCWSYEDINELRKYCDQTENFVWDENGSYDIAYSIADGILTDVFCGIICSALPTLKPICVMYRSKNVKSFHPELTDCYYAAYDEKELMDFLDMIARGEDLMYSRRFEAKEKYIKNFDGKNGERIKLFIEEKLNTM